MFVFILLILSCTISAQNIVGSTCTGFTTNGIANNTFLYYRLYDFRNIYNTGSRSTQNSITSKTVTNSSWTNDWYIRNYPRKSSGAPDIPVSFTPRRVSITNSTDKSPDYSTYLTLSSARINESTQEGGEITFDEFNVSYASIRVLGRVKGTPGACAGIFTYLNDTEESDIEMFTRDPANFVHYSNQPSSTGDPDWLPIPGATVNVSMPDGMYWTDWHVHRLDWTPGRSVFFVDDIQRNTTALQVPVADPPSGVYIDMWGANSTWVGSMPIGGEATFEIQWVELLFNTSVSSPAAPAENQKLCAIGDDKISWGLRLASICRKSLALWSILVILIVNY